MSSLLLTLGHNSSAILIEHGQIVWGYETERITGVKSDSRFPLPFVEEYLRVNGFRKHMPEICYVTHWAPSGQLSDMSQKHWDPRFLDGIPIRTLSTKVSHHDTHMAAAMCYAGKDFPLQKTFGVVIDGFGTLGEHFSVYDLSSGTPNLVRRIHGYDTSLGLWYQYATAFMGMKMHEDEYKLLGYEVHVDEDDAMYLAGDAGVYASEWLEKMKKSIYGSKYDPAYDINALANVKQLIFNHLTDICKRFNIEDPTAAKSRAILAFYVQAVLENVVLSIVEEFRPHNVILSGGVFYNVKLNRMFLEHIHGHVCIYPLAGDQGNAIGLYAMDHPEFTFPSTLNWGRRILKNNGQVKGLTVTDEDTALQMVIEKINKIGYVNLVRDSMEFGPRAMCNTSTLAVPTLNSVKKINEANNRNTVMPMAPVMSKNMYDHTFLHADRLWKSHAHMVCALEYKSPPMESMEGVAHTYEWPYKHSTGRPQTIHQYDAFLGDVFEYTPAPLINTSFNYHGMPIALGMESIINNHMMQYQRDNSFSTVVIKNV